MKEIILTENNFLKKILANYSVHANLKLREQVAEKTVLQIRQNLRELGIENTENSSRKLQSHSNLHVKNLENDGVSNLGKILTDSQIDEIYKYLKDINVYSSHVWGFSDKKSICLNDARKKFPQASYNLSDIFNAPHLLELAHDKRIMSIAQNYIGAPPTFYSCNLMWSFKEYNDPNVGVARNFHRDFDNIKYCTLYVFLTDTDYANGSHQYIKKSHNSKSIDEVINIARKQNIMVSDEEIDILYNQPSSSFEKLENNIFQDFNFEIKGKRGTAFIEDPYGYHRGNPPKNNDRLIFWIRYGIFDSGFSADIAERKIDSKKFLDRIPNDIYHKYFYRVFFNYEDTDEVFKNVHYEIPNELEFTIKNLKEKYSNEEIEKVLKKHKKFSNYFNFFKR